MAKQTLIQQSRRKPAQEKALYHDQLGAGRSKVRRPFFGISPQDEQAIRNLADTLVSRHIER